jgi:ornithine cyclodeaminase/alanine dehydrogenase-like protein (mu-crystallin family)
LVYARNRVDDRKSGSARSTIRYATVYNIYLLGYMTHGQQQILVLSAAEVEQLLPMHNCIEAMVEALSALARGEVYQPLRTVLRPQSAAGIMALMPAYRGGREPAFGLKTICVFPENPRRGKDAHQGSVMLFSGETGEMLALINASAITALRTAAVSAVATRELARDDASELAIIGSGVQARTHLMAISCVRQLKRARVVSRNPDHARQFATEMQEKLSFIIEPAATVEAALQGADLIVTATNAREPVIKRQWLSPGAHINAIGTYSPETREIDSATMAAARIFVDSRKSTFQEAGDYLLAAQEGVIGPDDIVAEIGELLIGQKKGRTSPEEITLFKSLGLAIEDLVCAEHLFKRAQATKVGTWVGF